MKIKKREMSDGDRLYYAAEWCETDGEISMVARPNRLMAMDEIQNQEGGNDWILWQTWHDEDTILMEYRSDRNHLALAAVSPTKEKAKAIIEQAMEELW